MVDMKLAFARYIFTTSSYKNNQTLYIIDYKIAAISEDVERAMYNVPYNAMWLMAYGIRIYPMVIDSTRRLEMQVYTQS